MSTDNFALAALYARQLIVELPTASNKRDPFPAGRNASLRVGSVRKLFHSILGHAGATIFMEIGCHDAEASHTFVSTGNGSRRAYAFEAIPAVFERAMASSNDKSVQFHNVAIGPENAIAEFNLPVAENLKAWGSLRKRLHSPPATETISVPMITLDRAAEMIGAKGTERNVGIWMDVEGVPFEILLSGEAFIQRNVIAIYTELYDSDVFAGAKKGIFVLELLLRLGFLPVARDNQFPNAYNLLAVHRDVYMACYSQIAQFHVNAKKMTGQP